MYAQNAVGFEHLHSVMSVQSGDLTAGADGEPAGTKSSSQQTLSADVRHGGFKNHRLLYVLAVTAAGKLLSSGMSSCTASWMAPWSQNPGARRLPMPQRLRCPEFERVQQQERERKVVHPEATPAGDKFSTASQRQMLPCAQCTHGCSNKTTMCPVSCVLCFAGFGRCRLLGVDTSLRSVNLQNRRCLESSATRSQTA